MNRGKSPSRKLKKLVLAIAGGVTLVLFLYMAIARVFIGVMPNWTLIPIGIGLILLAILFPYDNSEEGKKGQVAMRKRDRLLYGLLLPNIVLVVGMLIIANMESGASAAEFGGLAVFFMLLASLPITLTVNSVMLLQNPESTISCFARGMIPPGLVLIAAVIYQSGLWDGLT